ncbi:uncharacterized protein RAG0_06008 [Rhynchosporium agropyri]|uniref:Uncharacterized protein n=1 Tax=Rhynchosporium agropyri TaxID=914238 RepID=A0A1E1KFH6_9HELO|nr:uncharacterized protein RAG0_06008 [Rhynchosporium agropyri]
MGSGQGKIEFDSSAPRLLSKPIDQKYLVRTRSGGALDPIDLSTPSPPSRTACTHKPSRHITLSSNRIDESGRIKKLLSVSEANTRAFHGFQQHLPEPKLHVREEPVPKVPVLKGPARKNRESAETLSVRKQPNSSSPKRRSPKRSSRKRSPPRQYPRSQGSFRSPSPRGDISLHFPLQHALLNTTQKLLEEVLFNWTKRWVPSVLEAMRWEYPESAEFNQWTKAWGGECCRMHYALIDSNAGIQHNMLSDLVYSLHKLRNSAVHRHELRLAIVMGWMKSALQLTRSLGDRSQQRKMAEMEAALRSRDNFRLEAAVRKPVDDFSDIDAGSGDRVAGGYRPKFKGSRNSGGIDNPIKKYEAKALMPSVERGFGERRENQQSPPNGRRVKPQSPLLRKVSRAEVIDLTDEVEEDIETEENAPAHCERTTAKEDPKASKKRSFTEFAQDIIETSDDDRGYPGEDACEEDEDPDAIVFSSARPPGLTAAFLMAGGPTTGLDC